MEFGQRKIVEINDSGPEKPALESDRIFSSPTEYKKVQMQSDSLDSESDPFHV